jgi:alpha-ketoglutarate-dependent taurine dioxygenase
MPGAFGAVEILGLDPGRHTESPVVQRWLQALLWRHAVMCLRGPRPLHDDELRTVVEMFGPLKDLIGHTASGAPLRYGEQKQIIDSGFVLTEEMRSELGDIAFGGDDDRPGLFQFFHTDDSYVECPAAATVLHARQLPSSGGGATQFLDMRSAYTLLDSDLRDSLSGLRAAHAYNNLDAFPPRPAATGPLDELAIVHHPVVRAHPITGTPALYFDLDRARGIEGMADSQGRALLQSLQDHAEARAPRYSHDWRAHDVLVWDNASVQHRASGDFEVGQPRRFWRYMVEGASPASY